MVKHIILWKLKDELKGEEKERVMEKIKFHLENLKGKIPGLIEMNIITEKLDSSTADLMLDSTFESADALKNYSTHPEHVAVANNCVRPYIKERLCLDF